MFIIFLMWLGHAYVFSFSSDSIILVLEFTYYRPLVSCLKAIHYKACKFTDVCFRDLRHTYLTIILKRGWSHKHARNRAQHAMYIKSKAYDELCFTRQANSATFIYVDLRLK